MMKAVSNIRFKRYESQPNAILLMRGESCDSKTGARAGLG